jgi:hypothetical protein
MDYLLNLKGRRETLFWYHSGTLRQLWRADFVGSLITLVICTIHIITSWYSTHQKWCLPTAVTALLAMAQVVWMLGNASSYLRYQRLFHWAFRVLWLSCATLPSWRATGPMALSPPGHPELEPGSSEAFMFVMIVAPGHMLTSALTHLLPFRHMLPMTAMVVLWSMTCGLPQSILDAQRLQLQDQVQEACSIMHITFITLLTGIPPEGSAQCEAWQHASVMMLAFSRLVATAVIPLNLVYWYERKAKMAYLHQQRAHSEPESEESVLMLVQRICVSTWIVWVALSAWILLMQAT